jgi:3-oxoacyl-[acyl-carrier protein] reductase
MGDPLLRLANNHWTAPLVRALGLPRPRHLSRFTGAYREAELDGRSVVVAGLDGSYAVEACQRIVLEQGGALTADGPLHAAVVDATGCTSVLSLEALRDIVQRVARQLVTGGRILLLAKGGKQEPEAAACSRAVEGLMRSLAREIGRRGSTANAVYLTEAQMAGLGPVLGFFCCSDRSAYVTGQVLRLCDPQDDFCSVPLRFFAQQTAVVTGAAGAIGAATARRLAAEGALVVCVDIPSSQSALMNVAAQIGGVVLTLDITTPDAPERLRHTVSALGGVDIMVHNAGIARDRTLAKMSAVEWNCVISVNLQAVLSIDSALDMPGGYRKGAREICMASISGIAGNAGQTNYSASKAALIAYVEARARKFARRSFTVNAVAPGFIETTMTAKIPFMTREAGRRLNSMLQGGHPEDVAEAVAFLARPDSRLISGETLRVCGQSFLGA